MGHGLMALLATLVLASAGNYKYIPRAECGGAIRSVTAQGDENSVHSHCESECTKNDNCGGYNIHQISDASFLCQLVSHKGVEAECVESSKSIAVRDTRISSVHLREKNARVFLRCADLAIISNVSKLSDTLNNHTTLLGHMHSLLSRECISKQSCSLRISDFFDVDMLAEGTTIDITVQCSPSSIFNEDTYFTGWSSIHWKNITAEASMRRAAWKSFLANVPPYPEGKFGGRGVIIVAGGPYLEPALVLALRLRQLGFTDEIQFWHIGAAEVWPSAVPFLRQLQVVAKNFLDYVAEEDIRPIAANVGMRRFQLKPLALLHSNLESVLLLDADNIPIRDPTYLFNSSQFLDEGALFWPDYWTTSPRNPIWDVLETPAFTEWEQESGQIVINKRTAWRAIHLCVHLNNEYYMAVLNGDKDTFRFSWKASNTSYHMISAWPSTVGASKGIIDSQRRICGHTMLQHDMYGSPLFVHHNQMKDLILPIGDNFKYKQVGLQPARAVPTSGFEQNGKVIPCFEFQDPGINLVSKGFPVRRSKLELFEMFYAAALRTVRTRLRPDRIRHRRTISNHTVFYVDGAPELVSNCSANQTIGAAPTNTTDRQCESWSLRAIKFDVFLLSKTLSNEHFGLGSALAYYLQPDQGQRVEAPMLSLRAGVVYAFETHDIAQESFGFTITHAVAGGDVVSLQLEDVSGSPAYDGGTLTYRPVYDPMAMEPMFYGAFGEYFVGNAITINPPIWLQLPSEDYVRFNTAFNLNKRLFEEPPAASFDLLIEACKASCEMAEGCRGVYGYVTESIPAGRCIGLSDLGEPTAAQLIGESWYLAEYLAEN